MLERDGHEGRCSSLETVVTRRVSCQSCDRRRRPRQGEWGEKRRAPPPPPPPPGDAGTHREVQLAAARHINTTMNWVLALVVTCAHCESAAQDCGPCVEQLQNPHHHPCRSQPSCRSWNDQMLSLPQGEPRAWMMTLALGHRTTPNRFAHRGYRNNCSDLAQRRPRLFESGLTGKLLPSGVGLFEPGVPEDVTGPLDFVMRVNRQVFVQGILRTQSKRCDPAKAITAGRLCSHAELVAFGTWMVCDGMGGATKHPWPGAGCVQVAQGYCLRLRSYERRGSIAERSGPEREARYDERYRHVLGEDLRRRQGDIGLLLEQAVAWVTSFPTTSGFVSMQAPSRSTARL